VCALRGAWALRKPKLDPVALAQGSEKVKP